MADGAERLPIRAGDMPEITDAGVGLTLLMISMLLAERERQALHRQLATAVEARDWSAVAALHRRMADVAPAAARMADVARAGIDRFDAGMAAPGEDPADSARTRRSLVKAANWLDRRFWPMYGAVRPVMPPAVDTEGASAPAPVPPAASTRLPAAGAKACRKGMKQRLRLLDSELARLALDRREAAHTARLIMVADRNSHAARCRDCGRCPLSRDPLTAPLPTP